MSLKRHQLSLRAFLGIITVCGVVCLFILYFVEGYHLYFTCALCRANRVDYVYEGRTWGSSLTETACTQWYRDHVEPVHAHEWVHGRASAYRNLYGQRFGAIDFDPPGRVIWSITPEDQIAVYENLEDPIDGKKLFLNLASPGMQANNRDYDVLRSLQAWKESGFNGTWPIAP